MMGRMANLVVAGALAVGLVSGCTSMEESLQLKKPTARLMNVWFKEADPYGATLVFEVDILNNYGFDLPVLRFNYAVSSGGRRFLAGSQETRFTIPPYGHQTVSLPAQVAYLESLKTLGAVKLGSTIPYRAELDLIVNTPRLGTITLFLGKSGELMLPEVAEVGDTAQLRASREPAEQ